MNNSELEAKLKAAREPALEREYQEDFPRSVMAKLNSVPERPIAAGWGWVPGLAWGLAIAACVLIAFVAGHWQGRREEASVADALADTKLVRETLAMFPNRVRAIFNDEKGLRLILSDREDLPVSTPIYIRICDGKNCSSVVTFSGQEVQIAGQKLTVLSKPDGGIILEGNQFVWSGGKPFYTMRNLKIEARNLGPVAL